MNHSNTSLSSFTWKAFALYSNPGHDNKYTSHGPSVKALGSRTKTPSKWKSIKFALKYFTGRPFWRAIHTFKLQGFNMSVQFEGDGLLRNKLQRLFNQMQEPSLILEVKQKSKKKKQFLCRTQEDSIFILSKTHNLIICVFSTSHFFSQRLRLILLRQQQRWHLHPSADMLNVLFCICFFQVPLYWHVDDKPSLLPQKTRINKLLLVWHSASVFFFLS